MQPAGRAVNKPLALQSTTPISPNSPISLTLANITHKIYETRVFFLCTIILTLTAERILVHLSSSL